jgi:hypothetical protein
MALALQIPTQNTQARQIMEREFNTLIQVQMFGNFSIISCLSSTSSKNSKKRKTLILLFCDFFLTFYLKNDKNVPSKSNKHKILRKKIIFC